MNDKALSRRDKTGGRPRRILRTGPTPEAAIWTKTALTLKRYPVLSISATAVSRYARSSRGEQLASISMTYVKLLQQRYGLHGEATEILNTRRRFRYWLIDSPVTAPCSAAHQGRESTGAGHYPGFAVAIGEH